MPYLRKACMMKSERQRAAGGNTPPTTENAGNKLVYVAAIRGQKYVTDAFELGAGIAKQCTTVPRLGRRRANVVLSLLFVMRRVR